MLPSIYAGCLEVFAVGPDGNLGHMWQTSPNNGWSPWTDFAPSVQIQGGQPVVFQNADGRLEIFAIGRDGILGHMYQTTPGGTWSGWSDLGPPLRYPPAVFQNADGRLEVFAVGPDGKLGHMWQTSPNNGWSGWGDLGPVIQGTPSVFQNADGRLEVFAIGPDGNLGHMWQMPPNNGWSLWSDQDNPLPQPAAWSDWEDLGPEIAGRPAVFQNADGRLEVFAVGPDGNLGHMYQTSPNGGWSGWGDLGPSIQGLPVVFQNADGRLEIFAVGPDGKLGHMYQTSPNNGWTTWGDLGPAITTINAPPAVFQNADGRLEVFAIGADGNLGHMYQTSPNNGWSGWGDLGPAIQGMPVVFQNAGPAGTVPGEFAGWTNYIFSSNCQPLYNVSLTVDITQDLVGSTGWGFQLNCYSPKNENTGWQQYFTFDFSTDQKSFPGVTCCANGWPPSGAALYFIPQLLYNTANATLPSGYQLRIFLQNDSSGNVTGATYIVIDETGAVQGNYTISLEANGVAADDLAPIIAFQFVLVGPLDLSHSVLSSGQGTITYASSAILTATEPIPECAEAPFGTGEWANSAYSNLPSTPRTRFIQSFGLSAAPATPIPRGHGMRLLRRTSRPS